MENLVEWNSILAYQIPHIVSEDLGAPAPTALPCMLGFCTSNGRPMQLGRIVPGRKFSLVCVSPSLMSGGCERAVPLCLPATARVEDGGWSTEYFVPPARHRLTAVSWLLGTCLYRAQHVVKTGTLTGQCFVNCMQLSKTRRCAFPELAASGRDEVATSAQWPMAGQESGIRHVERLSTLRGRWGAICNNNRVHLCRCTASFINNLPQGASQGSRWTEASDSQDRWLSNKCVQRWCMGWSCLWL